VSVDHRIVGNRSKVWERAWTPADSMLYALAVGAGLDDPTRDLAFTTDNTAGVEQRAIPSLLCVLAAGAIPDLGPIDRHMLLHAEQEFISHKPLPVGGQLRAVTTVSAVWDKGSGALIVLDTECTDALDSSSLGTVRSNLFIRGAGGFGGAPQPASRWVEPTREPDHKVSLSTRPEQALWYRLTGDRNPLHSDPAFAGKAGFDRPILHGMCTYGFTLRALLSAAQGRSFASMAGRFTKPVYPGDTLTVSIWDEGDRVLFRTRTQDAAIAIDRGVMTMR
jgi:acyl dehydratase